MNLYLSDQIGQEFAPRVQKSQINIYINLHTLTGKTKPVEEKLPGPTQGVDLSLQIQDFNYNVEIFILRKRPLLSILSPLNLLCSKIDFVDRKKKRR